ncbi:MAG: hypothetical protein R2836_06390 [Chitinophagales bacterium]
MISLMLITSYSCTKTKVERLGVFDPFEDDDTPKDNFGSVVYFNEQSNDIVLINSATSVTSVIASNISEVYDLSLSYDKSKIAFINAQYDVVIMDTEGNIINEIDEPSSIRAVEWASDNTTLVYLYGNQIKKWGGTYPLPQYIPAVNIGVVNFSLSINGDLAVSFYAQGVYNYYGMTIIKLDGTEIDIQYNSLPTYISYSNQNNRFITVFGNDIGDVRGILTINADNTYSFDNNIFNYYNYASICADIPYRVDYKDSGDANNLYLIKDGENKLLTDFNNPSQYYLFYDWKQ